MNHREHIGSPERTYLVVFDHDDESGWYVATCPRLPGLVTGGETLDEARAMAADAIKGYLETLVEDGLPMPPSDAERSAQAVHELVHVTLDR